jgi:hypothetical protein
MGCRANCSHPKSFFSLIPAAALFPDAAHGTVYVPPTSDNVTAPHSIGNDRDIH